MFGIKGDYIVEFKLFVEFDEIFNDGEGVTTVTFKDVLFPEPF